MIGARLVSSRQLRRIEDAESSEETLIKEEPDSGEVSRNSSKINETIELQQPRSHDQTNLQEHESREANQTGRLENSRPESAGSKMIDETLQKYEFKQVNQSSSRAFERIEVQESAAQGNSKDIRKPEDKQDHEYGQVYQSSRESNETVRIEPENPSQLNNSSKEHNETVEEEHLSFSTGRVNGTIELQESSRQLIRQVHEAIQGEESTQSSSIYREANDMIEGHDSRESLFTRLVRGLPFSSLVISILHIYIYIYNILPLTTIN